MLAKHPGLVDTSIQSKMDPAASLPQSMIDYQAAVRKIPPAEACCRPCRPPLFLFRTYSLDLFAFVVA